MYFAGKRFKKRHIQEVTDMIMYSVGKVIFRLNIVYYIRGSRSANLTRRSLYEVV